MLPSAIPQGLVVFTTSANDQKPKAPKPRSAEEWQLAYDNAVGSYRKAESVYKPEARERAIHALGALGLTRGDAIHALERKPR